MLIWQGLGAYAFVIPFFIWLGLEIAVPAMLPRGEAPKWGTFLGGLALLISGPIVLVLARRWAARPGRVLFNRDTGQEYVIRDTMFFIPMKYWGYVYTAAGLVIGLWGLARLVGLGG